MIRTLAFAAVALAVLAGPASATDFTFDKAHTQAEFAVTHLGLGRVRGLLPLISGTLTTGANGLPTATQATFDVATLETYDDNRNASLRDKYFEAATYPTVTFVERRITGTPASFALTGDLTIHGITKSVTLNGKIDGVQTIRGKQNLAYSATTTIDRRDFGITFGPMLDNQLIAGYDVAIDLEATAVEK
jgi:polyisoprenoid-binding protein YceI